jgi:bacterioferritin-associated ferredoxin
MAGKVLVCRCEDVTLHELVDAIRRGHDDLESLKRYTGFGTGWCQGKWCQAACARVLSERGGDAAAPFTARPPYHPVALAHLAAIGPAAESSPTTAQGDQELRRESAS